jgi:hypothetical protein
MRKLCTIANLFALLIVAFAQASANPGSTPPTLIAPADLRGIYLYTNDISHLTPVSAADLQTALADQNVDGVNLVLGWDSIEPRPGIYQWDPTNGLTWSSDITYVRGAEVTEQGMVYASLSDGNLGHQPLTTSSDTLWNSTNHYPKGEEVVFGQDTYVSLIDDNLNHQPVPNCTYNCAWQPTWNPVGSNPNLLDKWIHIAAANSKKIALTIPAGSSIPSWLFLNPAPNGPGAIPLDFVSSPHAGTTGECDAETIAAPWDPAFLNQWDIMLTALANHLKSTLVNNESEYDAIKILRLTGINRTTEELRLPAETRDSTGLTCVSNAIKTWRLAGYRPSNLLEGWNTITDSFIRNFPDKSFSVSIIPQDPFPPINDQGRVIKGTVRDQNHPLIKSASEKLPGRLFVQFDFLLPGDPASVDVIRYATLLGTLAAFQTNEWLNGQGAACSGQIGSPSNPPQPCSSAADFLTLLNVGIYPKGPEKVLRGQYIEVFRANALLFSDALKAGHDELLTEPFVTLAFPDPPGGPGTAYTAPVIGTFNATATSASTIDKITCRHALVTNRVGLGTPNASAVVTASTPGDPIRVSCVATDANGNKARAMRPLIIQP